MSENRKIEILDAFLAEIRALSIQAISNGFDENDPLAQVRTACDFLETEFSKATGKEAA